MAAKLQDGLYRRFDLAAAPEKPFVMCGSEASADAAQKLLAADYVATAWPEAPGAWVGVDLRAIAGRKGLLIPDAAPDSRHDMQQMAARLHELGCKLRVTDTASEPEDWTVADFQGDRDEFIAWAKARTADYAPPAPAPTEPAPDEPIPLEAYAEEATRQPPRRRLHLAAVDGNTALAPSPEAAAQPAALSHDALAESFSATYGEDWRYVAKWGKWYGWQGDGWREDEAERIVGLAKLTTRECLLWPDAATLTASSRRDINSIGTAKALLSFARSKTEIAAAVDQWDTDPMLLGVPGGVIDLRSGQMLPPSREQYITKRCAVAPASGRPELWLKYLERAHEGIASTIAYLQRYAGYCATGETKEHALAFLYGTGRNGKGVFLETIGGILGDYARTASMDTFTEQKNPAHSTELARLHGARLVVTEEAAQGSRWNEGRVKHMTGGGKITAHYMRQDDFEFTPSFKLLVAANHKPMLRSVDEAIKSRIHLVHFNVTIPPEERDKDLLKKLESEWPQILGWMLDGCAEWQRTGLAVPGSILDATEKYVESEDVLGAWLEECCDRTGDAEGRALYESYRKWCERQGEHAWSRRAWSNTMLERGFDQRKSLGQRMFVGISLKAGASLP